MMSSVGDVQPHEAVVPASCAKTAPPNIRAVVRAGADFFLRCIDSLARLSGDDLVRTLIYHAMWMANVQHIVRSAANIQYGGFEEIPPDSARAPVSALSLAHSLHMPYETVRRHVQALLKSGRCVRVGRGGFIVPAEVHMRPPALPAIMEGVPNLLRLMSDLKRAGFDFTPYHGVLANTTPMPPAGVVPANIRPLVRAGIVLVLRGADTLGRMHPGGFVDGLIFTAIWTANVRHITSAAENLTFGGLDQVPPDEMRRPVTVNAIANSLRIPYETLRRAVNRMVRDGTAVRLEKGVIIPSRVFMTPAGQEAVRSCHRHVVSLVADIHQAGFDFRKY